MEGPRRIRAEDPGERDQGLRAETGVHLRAPRHGRGRQQPVQAPRLRLRPVREVGLSRLTEPAHGLRRSHTFPTIRSRGTAPKARLSRLTAALSPSKWICVEAWVSDTRFTRKRSESSGSRTTTRSPRRGGRTR